VYLTLLVLLEAQGRKLTEVQLSRLRAVFLWVASLTNYGKLKVQSGKTSFEDRPDGRYEDFKAKSFRKR
jgi:hypothetical protein